MIQNKHDAPLHLKNRSDGFLENSGAEKSLVGRKFP